jgi:type IV pilus assembly protein PilC
LKYSMSELYEDVQKGVSLSYSMRQSPRVFPNFLTSMVEAGEASGQLDRVFNRMAEYYETSHKQAAKVKSAMTYPVIVLTVAIAVIFLMLTFVIPTYSSMLKGMGTELPTITKFMLAVSDIAKSFWWLILGAIIGIYVGVGAYARSDAGKFMFSYLAIRIPVLSGVIRNVITARLTRTLGTLMASGVLMMKSMEIVKNVIGNKIIADKMEVVIDDIKQGKGLSDSLENMKYFQPMLISMIEIGEESGNIDFALEKCAEFYEEEVEYGMQKLTTFIEPIIILFLATIVGFIMLSILYPMLSVYQNMAAQ